MLEAKVPIGHRRSVPEKRAAERSGGRQFIGRDPKIVEVLATAGLIAATDAPVLITGESGVGKDVLAEWIHAASDREAAPFVAVNCGAIPKGLEESELFGHVAGAFTGATRRKMGKFETAHGGTIFLDEVGELDAGVQVKLLRILQTGEFSPVGSSETRRCSARVIAATNRNLPERVAQGRFREDLYYRLDVIHMELPPLRERRGDVPLLARHFIERYAAFYRKPKPAWTEEFERRLLAHDFPGNARELENMMHRAVILCREGRLTPALLPGAGRRRDGIDASEAASFHDAKQEVVESFERAYLHKALRHSGGIVSRAANLSGLSERNFHEKLKKYGIDGQSFRAS